MKCVKCVWGGMGGVGSEWVRGLGVGFTNPVGTEGVWDMCLDLGCSGVGVFPYPFNYHDTIPTLWV